MLIIKIFLKSLVLFVRGNRYLILPKNNLSFYLLDRISRKVKNVGLRNKVDWYTARQVFVNKENSLHEITHSSLIEAYYKRLLELRKTPFILDCGSNIGLTRLFYSCCYPDAKILLADIDKVNLQISQSNIASSDLIQHLHAAISNTDASYSIDDSIVEPNAFRLKPHASITSNTVNGVTINDLISKNSEFEPFVVKIDIEGHEAKLFESNTEWMEDFPIIIIELHDWLLVGEYSSKNLLFALSKYPRELVICGEHLVFFNKHKKAGRYVG